MTKTITQISMQKNSAKHCNVYLDGKFYCGLRLETVVERRLKVGMEISEEKLSEIQFESEYTHALDRAMEYLSKSAKTEKQVVEYLEKKGYTPSLIEKVVDKLKEYRFINDEAFAEYYASGAKNQKGIRLIKQELKQKGIDGETAEKVLSEFSDDEEVALTIAQKFLKGKEIDRDNLSKCYRKLLSKGFSYDTCSAVIEKIKDLSDN